MSRKVTSHLKAKDRTLSKLIDEVGSFKLVLKHHRTPFESLVEAVVYQQLTGKAAATILGRVLALFPDQEFPSPDQLIAISDEKLRGAGLSRAKTLAVKDIAAKTIDGTVPSEIEIEKMENAEIIERLTRIRGVGQWTVEMMLIFKLGRPDVLPTTDYGVRKGFATVYRRKKLPTPKELAAYGQRWAPYRSAAAWYLWRALDQPAKKPLKSQKK